MIASGLSSGFFTISVKICYSASRFPGANWRRASIARSRSSSVSRPLKLTRYQRVHTPCPSLFPVLQFVRWTETKAISFSVQTHYCLELTLTCLPLGRELRAP